MQILPVSYLEWGICIFTLWFCWWKYGGNMDVIKAMRQMYKKLEKILLASQDIAATLDNATSEVRHFHRIPVVGSPFTPRPNIKQQSQLTVSKRSFAQYLDNYVSSELSRNPQGPCLICDSPTKADVHEEIKQSKPLKNILDYETRGSENPWYIRYFANFVFFWRKWYIGEQYHILSLQDIMKDEKLKASIVEAAQQECKETGNSVPLDTLIAKQFSKTEETVRKMRAKQAAHPWYAIYVRIASWIIGKFLAQIYPKILVRENQIKLLHQARNSGHPILYLPIHRSHIDYVLISWTLFSNDIRNPLVAAGENLNIPVFSLMMKSVGGFFIKRKFETKAGKKDIVYRTMLHSYMRNSLMSDNDMEFFIEGGRTRTGKPCLPKGGLLSIVMESLLTHKVEDILVVPINFCYDKIVEGNYIREQLGQPKVNESFVSAAMALYSSLQPKYGNARVDYGHPFSMKEFVLKHCNNNNESLEESESLSSSSSESECDETGKQNSPNWKNLSHASQRKVVDALGRHALYEGIKCFTMTSTNAISFLLLNKFRNGVDIETLKEEMLGLRQELVDRGHDSTFTDNVTAAVNEGVKILGPSLVRIEYRNGKKFLNPVTELPNVIELSYYSNCVLPIYAMESIIATGVFKLLGDFCNNNLETNEKLRETELVATCLEYSEVLHYEFLLSPPCQPLSQVIKNTISFLSEQGILTVSLDADGERLLEIRSSGTLSRLVYLKNMLRPILDAYITAAKVLKRLVDCEAEEKRLQMDMLSEIKGQLLNKAILYGESMTLDPIRNFVQRASHWQILESHKKDLKNVYHLHDDFNNVDAVEEIIERLRSLRV